jgi:hypothetical protein
MLLVDDHAWPQKDWLAEAFKGGLGYKELKVIV